MKQVLFSQSVIMKSMSRVQFPVITVASLIIHLSLGYFQHTVPSSEHDSFQLKRSKYIPNVESCEPQKQSCDLTAQKFQKLINST